MESTHTVTIITMGAYHSIITELLCQLRFFSFPSFCFFSPRAPLSFFASSIPEFLHQRSSQGLDARANWSAIELTDDMSRAGYLLFETLMVTYLLLALAPEAPRRRYC